MKKNLFAKIFLIILSLIVVIIFFLWTSSPDKSPLQSNIYEQKITRPLLNLEGKNGIITNIWFRNKNQLDVFVSNDMKYLFVDVGDIEKNGKLITPDKEITDFIDFIKDYEKEKDYDFILLPYNEIILEDYDFSSAFRKNVIENHVLLVELGFDGAHVDIEAIPFNQRADYLNFLEELSKNTGKDKILTVYAGTLNEEPNIWGWEPDFFNAVSNRVDIILTQGYDFGKISKKDYQEYLTEQIKELSSKQWNSRILFTLPTHKIYPETLENALEVFSKNSNKFDGIAIFAEWTTSESEWKMIEHYNSAIILN